MGKSGPGKLASWSFCKKLMPPKLNPDRATPTIAICLGLKKSSRSFFIDAVTCSSPCGPIKLEYRKRVFGSQAFVLPWCD
jgi:hypothetical protein